jgi:hypothetical protein
VAKVNVTKARRKLLGLCVPCGKRPPIEGLKWCAECKDKAKRYFQEVRFARSLVERAERYSKDLCIQCGIPRGDSPSTRVCSICHNAYLLAQVKHLTKDGIAERRRSRAQDRVVADRAKYNAMQQAKTKKLKEIVLGHYGAFCACCEESLFEFLTIDHINGDGGKMRREGIHPKGGSELYRWIRQQGYPTYFQVLCYNCNCSKRAGNKCPHQLYKAFVDDRQLSLFSEVAA